MVNNMKTENKSKKRAGLDSTRGIMNLLRMLDQKPAGGF